MIEQQMDQRINHPVYEEKVWDNQKRKKKIPKFMGYDKKILRGKFIEGSMYIKKNLKIEELNFKEEQIRKKLAE